ncbi:MAG TPA: hypothetical protein VHM88_13475 [Candidatus Acidoferrales bacterium]|nr:hypothetical protein [Candidatus Acidoferrales bacterium]
MQRKKKGAKKKETEALWKRTPLMEIRSQRGFPQLLGKHKTLSTVPTRPDDGAPSHSSSKSCENQIKKKGTF